MSQQSCIPAAKPQYLYAEQKQQVAPRTPRFRADREAAESKGGALSTGWHPAPTWIRSADSLAPRCGMEKRLTGWKTSQLRIRATSGDARRRLTPGILICNELAAGPASARSEARGREQSDAGYGESAALEIRYAPAKRKVALSDEQLAKSAARRCGSSTKQTARPAMSWWRRATSLAAA